MKIISSIIFVASALVFSGSASAQFAKPEDAIKYRKSALFVMAQHFGRVAAMANGRVPFDAKAVMDNVAIAESMSKLPWAAFVEGSDHGETRAKPEIWAEQAKFKEANEKMMSEMSKLAVVAKTGNIDSIKAAVGAVGGSCKACHDAYQKK
jgi:cytochrome c556